MERDSQRHIISVLNGAVVTPGSGTIPQLKGEIENLKSQAQIPSEIPVDQIIPLQLPAEMKQPRLYFDPHRMDLLKDSIRKHGVLEPIFLRPNPNGVFEIISGERRWRCCRELGISTIPGIIRPMSDALALEAAIIAHLLSEEISLIEETESILSLLSLRLNLSIDDIRASLYQLKNSRVRGDNSRAFSNKQIEVVHEILNEFGLQLSSFVSNRLPLLSLAPVILASVREGKLSPTNAVLINRQPKEFQEVLITQSEGKTKRELLTLIRSTVTPDKPPEKGKEISKQIYERIKSVRRRTALLDKPEVMNRLTQIDVLLKEIESLDN